TDAATYRNSDASSVSTASDACSSSHRSTSSSTSSSSSAAFQFHCEEDRAHLESTGTTMATGRRSIESAVLPEQFRTSVYLPPVVGTTTASSSAMKGSCDDDVSVRDSSYTRAYSTTSTTADARHTCSNSWTVTPADKAAVLQGDASLCTAKRSSCFSSSSTASSSACGALGAGRETT
ncbi:unnamed protein product, partial [Amoebophrya sp. A120]